MIYLVTGAPGSGKTLYTVAKLIPELLKATAPGADGQPQARRLCVDGIPELAMPHEELAKPVRDAVTGEYKAGDGSGVWNWPQWCQAGDLIVIDEVQRHWRPRGMGTKPPPEIAALETHRHRGVDFVLITQHPMLIDQNVRRLIGRHEHVRRIFGMARALVYQWDGCQSDVSRLGSGTRTIFGYPKKAFELYKSSELHTRQKFKVPAFFLFPLVVAGLAVVAGPSAYSAITGIASGKGLQPAKAVKGQRLPNAPAEAAKAGGDSASSAALPALAASATPQVATRTVGVEFLGCIAMGERCSCFDMGGRRVELDGAACQAAAKSVGRVAVSSGVGAVSGGAVGGESQGYGVTPSAGLQKGNGVLTNGAASAMVAVP
jgi:zona occludens toxin